MDYIKVEAILCPVLPAREVLYADFEVLGFESIIDTETGAEAYIPANRFQENLLENLMVLGIPDLELDFKVTLVEQQNWNAAWESQFDPITVNENCTIRAPFHERSEATYDIIISPKMSFGTGHHETTFLISQKLFSLDLRGKSVMDMGCGTGVLAIIAKKLGSALTQGVDVEEWAYENSIENAELNGVSDIVFFHGDAEILGENTFDLFIANINRNILLADMNRYSSVMNDGAILLLSGFYSTDVDVIVAKGEECGLKFVNSNTKNNWAVVQLVK